MLTKNYSTQESLVRHPTAKTPDLFQHYFPRILKSKDCLHNPQFFIVNNE
jgi:hypothetical protein